MKNKHFAQVNASGVCVAMLETSGEIDSPDMLEIQPGAAKLGQQWTGTAWVDVPKPAAQVASETLEGIDRQTGMRRALREALIAIGEKVGADVAFLKTQESRAATERAKLRG
jgi:hypothetical protein